MEELLAEQESPVAEVLVSPVASTQNVEGSRSEFLSLWVAAPLASLYLQKYLHYNS